MNLLYFNDKFGAEIEKVDRFSLHLIKEKKVNEIRAPANYCHLLTFIINLIELLKKFDDTRKL